MKNTKYIFMIHMFIGLVGSSGIIYGQSLEKIGKERPVKITGGINLNNTLYLNEGIQSRRDPYNYFFTGSLNIDIYGWLIPLSFSYSNQNTKFQQPFNQYGLSPTFKNVTFHAGYRSLNFSKYTLNGHIFLGGGVECEISDKWKVAAIHGRLRKSVEQDTTNSNNSPSFERIASSFQVSYGGSDGEVKISVLSSNDKKNSLTLPPVDLDLTPEQNLAWDINFSRKLGQFLNVNFQYAQSALTKDKRSPIVDGRYTYGEVGLFKPKSSTSYFDAMNFNFGFKAKKMGLGIVYERVDPDFRTHGSYFFNNNYENIGVQGFKKIKNSLNIQFKVGVQRNNLDNSELSNTKRLSGNFNVNHTLSEKANYSINYTNFQTVTNIRPQFEELTDVSDIENLDTLNYRQVSQTANLNGNWRLSQDQKKVKTLTISASYQESDNNQGNLQSSNSTNFYNLNLSYSFSRRETGLTGSISQSSNYATQPGSKILRVGPTASVTKKLWENKSNVTLALTWNNSITNGKPDSNILNIRQSFNYLIQKKHRLNFTVSGIQRITNQKGKSKSFREFVFQFGYSYNFSLTK